MLLEELLGERSSRWTLPTSGQRLGAQDLGFERQDSKISAGGIEDSQRLFGCPPGELGASLAEVSHLAREPAVARHVSCGADRYGSALRVLRRPRRCATNTRRLGSLLTLPGD